MSRGDALVLDVRDADSYRRGHIEGSRLATKENLSTYLSDAPKNKPVIICCYHGVSSRAFAKAFAERGFSDVSSLDGGYEAWAAAEQSAPKAPAAFVQLSAELRAFLAEHGFAPNDINTHDKEHATPLMLAARLAPPALVKELLRAGADIHAVNADGNQALWLACVGEISEKHPTFDRRRHRYSACERQCRDAFDVRRVIRARQGRRAVAGAGADPLLETDLGLTALDMASSVECLDLMRAAIRRKKALQL